MKDATLTITIGLNAYRPSIHPDMLLQTFGEGLGRASFCKRAKIGARTFFCWVKTHEDFAAAYDVSRAMQVAFFEERLLDAIDSNEVNTPALLAASKMMGQMAGEREIRIEGFDPEASPVEQQKCLARALSAGVLTTKEADTITKVIECGIKAKQLTIIEEEVREIKEHIGLT